MDRGRVARLFTQSYSDGVYTRRPDQVVVEEPLEIRLDEVAVTTTMRTPGHDFELAVGFCLSEGLLVDAPVRSCRYCATGSALAARFNVVTVDTGGLAPAPNPRISSTTSSCGLCGVASIEALTARLSVLAPSASIPVRHLVSAPAVLRKTQPLFDLTGSIHGAAVLDPSGHLLVAREDIGRHNAVDKVVGRLSLDGSLPATGHILVVSGRASLEMVQKAWAGGFSALVSVSGPSGLAVNTARAAGLVLAGFVRDGGLNLYSGRFVDPVAPDTEPSVVGGDHPKD